MAARCGTADLAGLATPYGIVPVVRADKGMRNLVKDGVADVRGIRMADVMSGQGNHPPCVVALAGATSGMVQPDGPAVGPYWRISSAALSRAACRGRSLTFVSVGFMLGKPSHNCAGRRNPAGPATMKNTRSIRKWTSIIKLDNQTIAPTYRASAGMIPQPPQDDAIVSSRDPFTAASWSA